ncbi:hypothetical protein [Sphingomonas arenae]|uniref:hypothetical protein n=1 Tax=Sphingomonas arenae TaxID=2812555 RepID=UPI0019671B6E|nr:hypothetical protein [Sphingomonas arenae]
MLVSSPADADPKVDVHGLIVGAEGARYVRGVPTLDLQQQNGVVQVRFLGYDHNKPVFAVGFFNGGAEPVNVGIENIQATMNGSASPIFTVDQLAGQAKNRAMWAKLGIALGAGLGAAAAASQRSTYHRTMVTPRGTYSFSGSYPSLAGQLRANQIQAYGAYNLVLVQQRLDTTLAAIGDHVVQRTTLDPGDTYGGLVVLDKYKYGKPPFELRLSVDWNGERYPFAFLVHRKGEAVPAKYASMLAANAKPSMKRVFAPVGGSQTAENARAAPEAAVYLGTGVAKVKAATASGFCLAVGADYVGTGSTNRPVVSAALPRCSSLSK